MRLRALSDTRFDLVIVGGGIIGAGVARDAALRGLRVALLERADFGSGTTAASTRIAHGGLRYLEMLDFRLVRLDLREREILLRIAPHLVRPLEFLIPFYGRSRLYRAKLRAGLVLYDALSYDKSLPNHHFLSRAETMAAEPALETGGLQGAAAYHDAQVDTPERLCLENVLDAGAHGAEPCNYVEVTAGIRKGEALVGVRARDLIDGTEAEVHGRLILNITGPWADRMDEALTGRRLQRLARTKGIHVAWPPAHRRALVLFSRLDGRLFFAIPKPRYTWVGTTDTPFDGDNARAAADAGDLDYLRASTEPYLPALDTGQMLFTTAGVRALVRQERSPSAISRMHRVVDETRAGVPGLISVLGGKITGYRGIAEDVTDLVCWRLGVSRRAETARRPLPGGGSPAGSLPAALEPAVLEHLIARYGSRVSAVAALVATDPGLAAPLCDGHPDIAAEVVLAVREEHCVRVSDFLLRRSQLGLSGGEGRSATLTVAGIMGRELGWPAERQANEASL